MLPALASLIAVQDLDTAADIARRRIIELPTELEQVSQLLAEASAAVDGHKARLASNLAARRELEKDVAVIDGRLARFEDHKAAVKTNQEFTALLHEIGVAKQGKDELEDQILGLLEQADVLTAAVSEAERGLAAVEQQARSARAALTAERDGLDADIARLAIERARALADVDAVLVARYEQLLKQRRMLAVAPLEGDVCGGCHVKLRPALAQQAMRNTEIVVCDSCQRILYAPPRSPDADETASASA